MKKITFLFLMFFLFSTFLQGQFSSINFSSGLLQSDTRSNYYDNLTTWSDCNSSKIGGFLSFGTVYKLKKWISLEGTINYEERKALEVLIFPVGDNSGLGNFTFCKYPTSPQSKDFDLGVYQHFPNFKYLNLEIVPMFNYGNKFKISGGIGLFGGVLLNKNQLIITRDNIDVHSQFFFEPPHNVYGEIRYNQYNFGILPKVLLSYDINQTYQIGILAKFYYSLLRVNDTFIDPEKVQNFYWYAPAIGLNINYRFPVKS